jgi:hypothetical protein
MIERVSEETRRHLLASYVMRNAAEELIELEDVRAEASREGWDGYGALPLDPEAFDFARRFLNALPTAASRPAISANPDGEVALDWVFGMRRALTVSIGPAGRCTFAWMLGEKKFRGTDWIEDEIPASIAFALGQLDRESVSKQAR